MNEDDVHRRLLSVLGPEQVSRAEADLLRYASDALRPSRMLPGSAELVPKPQWVVWPRSVEQVQGLVRLANELRVPLVPYGGGTGLMGGAMAARGGIVVDTGKLDRIRAVHPEDRTVTAEAGVVLKDLDATLNERGLMLGHDPWTVPVATVAGTISTNGLGYRGAQYGSMGDQVLGIEAVLPDGRLLTTRAVPKASTGPALHQLFIGAEGCFGIIVAATLKVFPLPERRGLHAIRFPSFEAGFQAISRMFALGLAPALLEYGEDFPPLAPTKGRRRSQQGRAELYLGFEGLEEVVQAQERRALALCQEAGGVCQDPDSAVQFWQNRHAAAERFVRQRTETGRAPFWQPAGEGPQVDYVHVALPASRVLEYRSRCIDLAARQGVQLRDCGLWNRPELFSMVLVDPGQTATRLHQTVDEVLVLAQEMGGAMEYCHGVGVRLAHLMAREHGEGLEVLRQLKRTLDPNDIMNPGKLAL